MSLYDKLYDVIDEERPDPRDLAAAAYSLLSIALKRMPFDERIGFLDLVDTGIRGLPRNPYDVAQEAVH